MAWIQSHTVLLRHRKVLQLATDLTLPAVHVVGHLHALWHTVLEQQENGDLTDWPDDMIAQAAAYPGPASAFVSALQARKWLDGKIIHDWMDYAGRYLLMKYRTSNPKRLLQIQKLHQSVSRSVSSRTKVRPKSDILRRDNKPNITNPHQTLTAPSDFERFWECYPRKEGRKAARVAWNKATDKPGIEVIEHAIERARATEQWQGNNGKFIPHPTTWLNQGRWADEPMKGLPNGHVNIPPFPGPDDPIGRGQWRRAYGDPAHPKIMGT